MNFRQRFLRYGIGVFVGLLLSIFFFQGRGCNDWLPEKRIKSRMQLDGVLPSEALACWMECAGGPAQASNSTMMQWLLESEINWSESRPRQEPPCYILDTAPGCPLRQLEVCFGANSGVVNLTSGSGLPPTGCDCPGISVL
ncbi:hypothetical protein N9L13_06050 [Flavobacteriales bacterium]|nr:hypothetical protein [Flavobacteriales bacterium]